MQKTFTLLFVVALFTACTEKNNPAQKDKPSGQGGLTEFSNVYTSPVRHDVYSNNVKDSFTIFQSVPSAYNKDSAKRYPLVILLDGNAFTEPFVAAAKFNTFIGDMEESIIAGVGHKDFPTLDSVRSRDYTYPTALPEYEMALSGGGDKFKRFIDDELLPQLEKDYKIDTQKIILCGHSLGGYFALYYLLQSAKENRFVIHNFVSASPSLFYNNRYLFAMEDSLARTQKAIPANLYISMGSRDMEDSTVKNILGAFATQVNNHHYNSLQLKAEEYSNFGHMDAALPGFLKGMQFVFARPQ